MPWIMKLSNHRHPMFGYVSCVRATGPCPPKKACEIITMPHIGKRFMSVPESHASRLILLMQICKSTKPKQGIKEFIEASREPSVTFMVAKFNGILGLRFQEIYVGNAVPVWYNMVKQSLVKELDFSFGFNRNAEEEEGGELVSGGVDQNQYKSKHTYVPVTQKGHWQFDMGDALFGGKSTGNQIMELLLAEPKKISSQIGLCTFDGTRDVSISNNNVVDEKNVGKSSDGLKDAMCSTCEMTVVWMQNQPRQNQTQERILDYINELCEHLPSPMGESVVDWGILCSMVNVSFTIAGKKIDLAPSQYILKVSEDLHLSALVDLQLWMYLLHAVLSGSWETYSWVTTTRCLTMAYESWICRSSLGM